MAVLAPGIPSSAIVKEVYGHNLHEKKKKKKYADVNNARNTSKPQHHYLAALIENIEQREIKPVAYTNAIAALDKLKPKWRLDNVRTFIVRSPTPNIFSERLC